MAVTLTGQGEPLPAEFPYKGEWMLKPRMFLYTLDEATAVAPIVPQFTAELNAYQEDWSFGFDARNLARCFCISSDAVREANRRGELTLENVLANTPDGENADVKIYVFRYAGKTVEMVIERLKHAGSA
jgi:hypothetical protein